MAWAKIDDGWWCHPKVMALSLPASGLWARALSWSCQQRREVVPERFLMMVGADQAHADELVHAGLWIEVEGGYLIHDWSEYQEQSLSEKRADAGRKGGRARRSKDEDEDPSDQHEHEANGKQDEANDPSNGQANAQAGALPGPSPPSPTQPEGQGRGARKRATQLPDDWQPNERHRELATSLGVDLDRERQQFEDHHAAKGSTFKDWDRAFNTWLRNAQEFGRGKKDQPARADGLVM